MFLYMCCATMYDFSVHAFISLFIVEPLVFSLERDRYEVNETAGTVRIGVVKTSGNIPSGESVTLAVTPSEGAGQVEGAGTSGIVVW